MPPRGHFKSEQRSEVECRTRDATTTKNKTYRAHGREHTGRRQMTRVRDLPRWAYGYRMHDQRIDTFLSKITTHDGSPALSDAKVAVLSDASRALVIEEDGDIVALGVVAAHGQPDGTKHHALETVLDPGLRFDVFEDRLLESALVLAPRSLSMSVWSHRHSFDAALTRAGFSVVRELAQMAIELPIGIDTTQFSIRTYESRDAMAVVALNNLAFASHREAATLSESDITTLMSQTGFETSGLFIMEDNRDVVGFCWTRVHQNGDGEIYRIAVSPDRQGGGLGRSLTLLGFDYLAHQPGTARGVLWVDTANEAALSLYESLGMTRMQTNREFERQMDD